MLGSLSDIVFRKRLRYASMVPGTSSRGPTARSTRGKTHNTPDPYPFVMVKSYPVRFVTKHWHVLQISSSYTSAMSSFSDVVWYDLTITDRMGMLLS